MDKTTEFGARLVSDGAAQGVRSILAYAILLLGLATTISALPVLVYLVVGKGLA